MNAQEVEQAQSTLERLFLKLRGRDALENVEAYLREGKPEKREISQDSGRAASYYGIADYRPQERVQVLAEAILQGVVSVGQMEHDVWDYLQRSIPPAGESGAVNEIRVVRQSPDGSLVAKSLRRNVPMQALKRLEEDLRGLIEEARR
jgi:hypothetical protein